MDWFPDMLFLLGEWWVWQLIASAVGLFVGWVLWGRRWRRDREEAQRQLADLRADRIELRNRLAQADEEADQVRSELSAQRSASQRVEQGIEKRAVVVGDLEARVARQTRRVEELEAALDHRDARVSDLEAIVARQTRDIDSANVRAGILERDLDAARREATPVSPARTEGGSAELSLRNAELAAELAAARSELVELRSSSTNSTVEDA